MALRYNTRLIRKGLSYTVQDIAELFGVHKNAVLRWVKDGLPIIDRQKPYLIHAGDLTEYLNKKQSGRKHQCKPDELFCFKCRVPRRAWEGQADIVIRNESKLTLSALCCVCDTLMHRAGSVRKLGEYQKIFSVQAIQERHITDRHTAIVNSDMREDQNHA